MPSEGREGEDPSMNQVLTNLGVVFTLPICGYIIAWVVCVFLVSEGVVEGIISSEICLQVI